MTKDFELIRIGKYSKRLHAVDPDDPDGRALCETRTLSKLKHRLQDDHGGYSDHELWSPIIATGKRGAPTCADCHSLATS